MTQTGLFRIDRSQAARLSENVPCPETVREIVRLRDGARWVLVPADAGWDGLFDSPGTELSGREQPQ